jgi:hypothetical protein
MRNHRLVIGRQGRPAILCDMPKRNGRGIARQVRRPSRIALELGLSRPAVSRQLRLLREAGLIDWRAHPGDGRAISYFINREMAAPIIAWLAGTDVGRSPHGRAVGGRLEPVRSDLLRWSANAEPRSLTSTGASGDGSA